MASLIYEAQKKLGELIKVKNIVILVLDKENQMFMKLNSEE